MKYDLYSTAIESVLKDAEEHKRCYEFYIPYATGETKPTRHISKQFAKDMCVDHAQQHNDCIDKVRKMFLNSIAGVRIELDKRIKQY